LFVNDGILPKSFKSITWIKDHLLVGEGYSLQDIDGMESERYDFLINFCIEKRAAGKSTKFNEGL